MYTQLGCLSLLRTSSTNYRVGDSKSAINDQIKRHSILDDMNTHSQLVSIEHWCHHMMPLI